MAKNGKIGLRYLDRVPRLVDASPTAMPNVITNTTQNTRKGSSMI
jgi:hypothetical protein